MKLDRYVERLRPFKRSLPICNIIACLLFVLLREPAPAEYFAEIETARQAGFQTLDTGIWGTLACRTLNNWGPFHGGEAPGVMVLEIANLPSLLVVGMGGLMAEVSGYARNMSACRWSWLLAGWFVLVASAQWWIIGSIVDKHRQRLPQQTNGVAWSDKPCARN